MPLLSLLTNLMHKSIFLTHTYPKLLNVSQFPQKYEAAQLFTTLSIIINVSWAANQHRMISEGSCDTEDWSNDAENTALITRINYILIYIQIENNSYKL